MEEFAGFLKDFAEGAIPQEEYWQRWRNVWDASSHITEYFNGDLIARDSLLSEIFTQYQDSQSSFMSTTEQEKLSSLPKELDIFRGGQQANISGWSWTLDRDSAQEYALSGAKDGRPLLVSAFGISSSAILAYLMDGESNELIVDPLTVTIETAEHADIFFERL